MVLFKDIFGSYNLGLIITNGVHQLANDAVERMVRGQSNSLLESVVEKAY